MQQKFTDSFDSLQQRTIPDWFRDAKFGIWSHWGPQSVAMYGDWYARNMYIQGTPQYYYHLRHFGHPSKFGYKDLCQLWKAENFDPEGLMDLYYKAGARYFMAQASHHDHFFNYDSQLNRFNSVQMGPKKDICALWQKAAHKRGMPFGLTEHLAMSFAWFSTNKDCDRTGPYAGVPYDGNDPAYRDFYWDNEQYRTPMDQPVNMPSPRYSQDKNFQQYWLKAIKEMIDKFHPELLYSDSPLPFGNAKLPDEDHMYDVYGVGMQAVAYLYNDSIDHYGDLRTVYLQKDNRPVISRVGVLDIERGQLNQINPLPWQTDTCIGDWFYDVRAVYKTPAHIIETLVDIISKNGTLLLNIVQRPDGTLDDEAIYLLQELAGWFAICSEGVYDTRPWRVFGEGDSHVVKEEAVEWTSSDFRFTQKNGVLYAFQLRAPENGVAVIKSLTEADRVQKVELLGHGQVDFTQAFGVLSVKLPEKMPTKYANCLKITLA